MCERESVENVSIGERERRGERENKRKKERERERRRRKREREKGVLSLCYRITFFSDQGTLHFISVFGRTVMTWLLSSFYSLSHSLSRSLSLVFSLSPTLSRSVKYTPSLLPVSLSPSLSSPSPLSPLHMYTTLFHSFSLSLPSLCVYHFLCVSS